MQDAKFIEVKKVMGDKETGINTHSSPESLPIESIGPFRAWKKGVNDRNIKGEMTFVMIKNAEGDTDGKKRVMLIEESYDSFRRRLGAYVIIKGINDLP